LKKKFSDVEKEILRTQDESKNQKKKVLLLDLRARLLQKVIIFTMKREAMLNKKGNSICLKIQQKKNEKIKKMFIAKLLSKFAVI
jgi:hypothetical protein